MRLNLTWYYYCTPVSLGKTSTPDRSIYTGGPTCVRPYICCLFTCSACTSASCRRLGTTPTWQRQFFPGTETHCDSSLCIPFLLGPAVAFCGSGSIHGRHEVHDCVRLVSTLVLAVACAVCGEPVSHVQQVAWASVHPPFQR